MDLKELNSVDPWTHWYYRSKLVALRSAIRRRRWEPLTLMDVGAGSGFFSEALIVEGVGTSAVCVDPNYSDEDLGVRGAITYVRETKSASVENSDLLLFIDVLEHVDDDHSVLASYISNAKPGAGVIITVPAFMSMWSAHDVFLEHRRRYRLADLEALARESGLHVLDARYLFGSIFPVAWLSRRCRRSQRPSSDLRVLPSPVNWVLRFVSSAEHSCVANRIAGTSAMIVACVSGPLGATHLRKRRRTFRMPSSN